MCYQPKLAEFLELPQYKRLCNKVIALEETNVIGRIKVFYKGQPYECTSVHTRTGGECIEERTDVYESDYLHILLLSLNCKLYRWV